MGITINAFGLGWFLRDIGVKKIAIGDTKGQLGTDWWPLNVDKIETELFRRRMSGNKGGNAFLELLVFSEVDGNFSFQSPSFRSKLGLTITLTCAVYVKRGHGVYVVCRKENGGKKESSYFTVDQLKRMAGVVELETKLENKKDVLDELKKKFVSSCANLSRRIFSSLCRNGE